MSGRRGVGGAVLVGLADKEHTATIGRGGKIRWRILGLMFFARNWSCLVPKLWGMSWGWTPDGRSLGDGERMQASTGRNADGMMGTQWIAGADFG